MKEIRFNTLTRIQSDNLLSFCKKIGVNYFSFPYLNFSYLKLVDKKEISDVNEKLFKTSVKEIQEILKKLEPLKTSNNLIKFNNTTLEILKEIMPKGILPKYLEYDPLYEDILLYKEETLILEIISHEELGVINLKESDLNDFNSLEIKHSP